MKNRRIYLFKDLYDNLRLRAQHVEDGIASDPLITKGNFSQGFNRKVLKTVNRFIEFLKTASDDEIENFFNKKEEISSLDNIYTGLMVYSVENLFRLYFSQNKKRLGSDEYKLLYLVAYDKDVDFSSLKEDLDQTYEWKREYILNETQARIAKEEGYNIVLGAAGTGKTDVAINTYLNNMNLDSKVKSLREEVFITYSKKLCDYVSYSIDMQFSDYKANNMINAFTTIDFFINVLASANVDIEGYRLENSKYVKDVQKKFDEKDLLENNIASIETFIKWKDENYKGLSKSSISKIDNIIDKYGIEYPYLFFRGIYKGKIINKVSDKETQVFLSSLYSLSQNQVNTLNELLDNYVEYTDSPSQEDFHEWYLVAKKRYSQAFKQLGELESEANLYDAFNRYYDFVSPVREDKRFLDYYPLFLREVKLIEGYRGQTRDGFDCEIEVLYDTSKAFCEYLDQLNIYDDNDLAFFIIKNIDKIKEKGIYKNIIVDEFQDMTERQLHTLVRLNYDENEYGRIHLFGDFEQTINPTFIQLENIETIYMINGIEDYKKQILSSTYRYSDAICRELEALREKGRELFGTEDQASFLPLKSNKDYAFETNGNLVIDIQIADKMMKKITSSKKANNIMYIVADQNAKYELADRYKCNLDNIYTISESKGRESDFVVVYKICSSKALEYENLFSKDFSYSRAGRIFYNQLYVGITRCKTNFLQIEDSNILGKNTIDSLKKLIAPLLESDVDLFLEEMLSDKINYYFRALESFKNLDFKATADNLSFYCGEDYYSLAAAVKQINIYNELKNNYDNVASYASLYKNNHRFDLARIVYTVLDNSNMLKLMDIKEKKDIYYSDEQISNIIKENHAYLDDSDINDLDSIGYFLRKKKALENKINNMKIEVIK